MIRSCLPVAACGLAAAALLAESLVDLDGDGVSDLWQARYDAWGLDPEEDEDGDGWTNRRESEMGTDPFDPQSRFEGYRFESDEAGVAFLFQGVAGQSYGLEESKDLVNWSAASEAVLSGGGGERLVARVDGGPARFLRFRVGGDQDGDGISDFEESLLGYDPLSQHSDPDFLGGDLARLSSALFSADGLVETQGKSIAGRPPSLAEASRFLTQATLGATMAEVEAAREAGYDAWLEDQFAQEPGLISPRMRWWYENHDNVFFVHRRYAWWEQVMTSPDLLRQRLAVALSEIFVVSDSALDGGASTTGMADFYDLLLERSLGNWRDLLRGVSLHPAMGMYLSHLQNRKADPELNRYPDENFAREIMQLFSIGLFELNSDGTREKDAQGRDIATYDNETITHFARVFTGLSFGGPNNRVDEAWHFLFGEWVWDQPMKMWPREHDREAKTLLNGTALPAFEDDPGRVPMDDFEDAIDNLFHHPNVGPFLAYRLIQRLVKSNPSPGYVRRVSQVFDDNGAGARGDMKSVVRAILLDIEARSLAAYDDPGAGRLREPYLRWVRLVRSLEANSENESYLIPDWGHLQEMGQRVMSSNSVFNFFLPDYQPPGELADAGLVGPEFQILTATTALSSQNIFGGALMWGFGLWDDERPGDQMGFGLEEEVALLEAGDLEGVIERLDTLLCHGTLTEGSKQVMREAYAQRAGWFDSRLSAAMLVRIVLLSPEFAVTR